MKRNLFIITFFTLFCTFISHSQTNILKDPFFLNSYQLNSATATDKWIHVINTAMVDGEMKRTKLPGFNDSIVHCHVAYKTVSSNNRSNCYLGQRITGLQAKKYRISFWSWVSTSDMYYTAELSYLNSDLTTESSIKTIIQTKSSSLANYHLLGNWEKHSFDVDLRNITDLQRLSVSKLSIFPNCNNVTTLAKPCDYFFAEPQIYEINDSFIEYFKDGDFNSWQTGGNMPTAKFWFTNLGNDACSKRAQGHRDTDYCYWVKTSNDNDGTYLETTTGSVFLPRTEFKFSFYARSETDGGQVRVILGTKDIGSVVLSPNWKRYELTTDYSNVPIDAVNKVRFEMLKANSYFIDACWVDRTDSLIETNLPVKTIEVTTNANSGEGSLRQAIIDASAGDSIVIPKNYTISLASEIAFSKNLKINGQGSTIQVAVPGSSSYRVFTLGTSSSTATTVSLYNLVLQGGSLRTANGGTVLVNLNHNFTMKNCTISKGRAPYAGGLMINSPTGTSVTLENCTFSENEATTGNGGACILRGNAIVKNCIFSGNLATATAGDGSAIAAYNQSLIQDCSFINNVTKGAAGAAVINYASAAYAVNLSNCTFEENLNTNETSGAGAFAVASSAAKSTLTNCTFYKNSGPTTGAIWNNQGALNIVNCTFAGNFTTSSNGAAINNTSNANSNTTLVNSILTHNYNVAGLSDVSMGDLGTINGANNIVGTVSGSPTYTNSIFFSYSPASDLFASYTSTENLMPILADHGGSTKTIALSNTSIAKGAGVSTYGNPNMIPLVDQLGNKRPEVPCIGSAEYKNGSNTGVSEPQSDNFLIYPNPATSEFNINNAHLVHGITIYDFMGKKVFDTTTVNSAIRLKGIPAGIYLVKVKIQDREVVQRLQIK